MLFYNASRKQTEAAVRRCSSRWVLSKISQYSQENIGARVSFYGSCKPEGLQLY